MKMKLEHITEIETITAQAAAASERAGCDYMIGYNADTEQWIVAPFDYWKSRGLLYRAIVTKDGLVNYNSVLDFMKRMISDDEYIEFLRTGKHGIFVP